MGILDNGNSKRLDYLEEERKKLWERITHLEDLLKEVQDDVVTRAPQSEKEAKAHSKKAAEFRNRTEDRLHEATVLVQSLTKELEASKAHEKEIMALSTQATEAKIAVDEVLSRLQDSETEYEKKLTLINSKVSTIDNVLTRYPDLSGHLEKLEEFSTSTEENFKKSGLSLTNINKRKEEIDDLYRELFGYTETDDAGKEKIIEGLKDELENTFEDLSKQIEESSGRVETLNSDYETKYSQFEEGFKKKYQKINEDITSLLPAALTAGLSSAFSTKKEDEVKSSKSLQTRFTTGIVLLVIASLIPVVISIVFLYQNVELETVINRLPRLVLALVPLYIPLLWFTYSANKKLNLSKRLIEEYAHKEVLSKTYEGLARQIENIQDNNQSQELKFRLLSNFLQVSSENPGKLISNYEASDHPVMEALEQSYKFQIAIDKLESIPGLGKVAAILERKAKKKVQDKSEKIENVLSDDAVSQNGSTEA